MRLVTLSCLLLFSIVAFAQPNQSCIRSLDSLFTATFKTGEPGGSVLIAKDGQVFYKKGFGLEDLNTKKPITTESLFNVGSISKTFVAFSILRLADEGKLSLADDIYRYFPDFRSPEIAKKIKIVHLLTHSSGLPDNRKITEDSIFFLTAKDEENFAPLKETDSLHFEPGERFEYSNPAFNALALIIEKVTGKKWQDYVKETIFKPSGMKRSDITDGPHPQSGVSHGYLKIGDRFSEKDYGEEPTFAAAGNGGVWSSVEELWKYEQAIQKNTFLKRDIIDTSRTIVSFSNWKDTLPPFIGLCWFITRQSDIRMIGHTGSQGGFRGDYQWLPDKNIFFVVLCNTPGPIDGLREKSFAILQRFDWLNQ